MVILSGKSLGQPLTLPTSVVGRSVGPDLDPNCLTLWWYMKEFFEKVGFEKN